MRRSVQSSRSPSAARNAGGWPVPSGIPSVSAGRAAAAASLGGSGPARGNLSVGESLRAQAREDDLEVALPGHRRAPGAGAHRAADAADQARARPRRSMSARSLPLGLRPVDQRRRSRSSNPTASSTASPQIRGALVHRLREQPVLGHHPGRVGHELDEALPAVVRLERVAGAPRRGASKRASASASSRLLLGREVAIDGADADPGVAGDLVDLRVEPAARRTACAPTRARARGCGARRRAGCRAPGGLS